MKERNLLQRRRCESPPQRSVVHFIAWMMCALLPHFAIASSETDRLAEAAAKGDAVALESLFEMARKKDADAEYALGLLAGEGRGLERNTRQSFQLIERSAAKGHAEASNLLGYYYEHGIGTSPNVASALAAYRKGAEAGSARARTNLGWFYEQGIGVAKDAAVAADLYKQAADQGLAAAHANLANLYETGNGVAKNPIVAMALYERAFAGGIASAALRLGRLHEVRGNLPAATENYVAAAKAKVAGADLAAGRLLVAAGNASRDLAQGVAWLEQAAARDNLDALVLLANLHDKGEGGPLNPALAANYFQRAATLGDAESAYRYAQHLVAREGKKGQSDPLPWYRIAADKGHAAAQYELAILLEQRDGTAGQQEAVDWYRKSAKQGNLKAALRLGMALETGGDAAPSEAFAWYQKAAQADDPEALYRLGNLYDRGIGTPADFNKARDYYSRAASLGHAGAAVILQRMVGVPTLEGLRNDPFKGIR